MSNRAHMRMAPVVTPAPAVEKIEVEQPTVHNVIGTKDIVWSSFNDLCENFSHQFAFGNLSNVETPIDASKKTTVINGEEVKRIPHLDDFAEMMRREDAENHTRLERYASPLSPVSGMNWFTASVLGVMIENGRIGIKDSVDGIRELYINRKRTGNPFFRIWGGRMTFLIGVAQWFFLMGLLEVGGYLRKADALPGNGALEVGVLAFFILFFFLYNLIHWRFYKRYSFVMGVTLVDGWKARNMPTPFDVKWYRGRPGVHAVNLSIYTTIIVAATLHFIKVSGWV